MGEHKGPRRVNGITGALLPAVAPPMPDRILASEFQTLVVSKRSVIFLSAECIREVPPAEEGGAPSQEIFAKRTQRNDETGEIVVDDEPGWHRLDAPNVAWPIERKNELPRELCDIVCVPVSIVADQQILLNNGQPRVSKILLMEAELFRIDAASAFAKHEEQLSGRRSA